MNERNIGGFLLPFFVSLFLRFFISVFLYLFVSSVLISLLLCFLVCLFLCLFISLFFASLFLFCVFSSRWLTILWALKACSVRWVVFSGEVSVRMPPTNSRSLPLVVYANDVGIVVDSSWQQFFHRSIEHWKYNEPLTSSVWKKYESLSVEETMEIRTNLSMKNPSFGSSRAFLFDRSVDDLWCEFNLPNQ